MHAYVHVYGGIVYIPVYHVMPLPTHDMHRTSHARVVGRWWEHVIQGICRVQHVVVLRSIHNTTIYGIPYYTLSGYGRGTYICSVGITRIPTSCIPHITGISHVTPCCGGCDILSSPRSEGVPWGPGMGPSPS